MSPYCINTSQNNLIRKIIIKSGVGFKADFERLLQGNPVDKYIDEHMVFNDIYQNEGAAWTLLLDAGYLKVLGKQIISDGLLCRLDIPNQEVRNLYRLSISKWLSQDYDVERHDRSNWLFNI